jgi:hypothetical protein
VAVCNSCNARLTNGRDCPAEFVPWSSAQARIVLSPDLPSLLACRIPGATYLKIDFSHAAAREKAPLWTHQIAQFVLATAPRSTQSTMSLTARTSDNSLKTDRTESKNAFVVALKRLGGLVVELGAARRMCTHWMARSMTKRRLAVRVIASRWNRWCGGRKLRNHRQICRS